MLPIILLLNLILCISDAESSPKSGLEDLENLVEKLVESRLRDMETRLESKEKVMESRLEELEDKMKEGRDVSEKREAELKASIYKLGMVVEECSNYTLDIFCFFRQ